jgi:hypothetical protein
MTSKTQPTRSPRATSCRPSWSRTLRWPPRLMTVMSVMCRRSPRLPVPLRTLCRLIQICRRGGIFILILKFDGIWVSPSRHFRLKTRRPPWVFAFGSYILSVLAPGYAQPPSKMPRLCTVWWACMKRVLRACAGAGSLSNDLCQICPPVLRRAPRHIRACLVGSLPP